MRYRKVRSITIDPEIADEAKKLLPQGKIRNFSQLVEDLLTSFIETYGEER